MEGLLCQGWTGQIEQLAVWSNGKVKEVGTTQRTGSRVCSEEGHAACTGDVWCLKKPLQEDIYAQTPGPSQGGPGERG